ncbi:MAG: zinc-binding dehydrogenase [Pseudomonadales bacterium]|nr:zinc-binding dehydrogenase [Pseudomonadales bacterium]
MMRALVMRPGSLRVETRPLPEPGAGQVLVRVLACGICGSDLHLFRHAEHYRDAALQAGVPAAVLDRGVVLGHEFVGEIVRFGTPGDSDLAVGTRVCALPFLRGAYAHVPMGATPFVDGAYAQYCLLDNANLLPVPASLPTDAAALTEPLAIGLHAVNAANLTREHDAVVIGCGPIGLATIAALAQQGRRAIVASDLSATRRALALRMGATRAVDAATTSPFADLAAGSAGRPVSVFDCTGSGSVLETCIQHAPHRSEIVVAGISHGSAMITPATAVAKELSLRFVSFYSPGEFADALQMLASGRVDWRPWITGTTTLEAVREAFLSLADTDGHVKILVKP